MSSQQAPRSYFDGHRRGRRHVVHLRLDRHYLRERLRVAIVAPPPDEQDGHAHQMDDRRDALALRDRLLDALSAHVGCVVAAG
eukprot:6541632-Prymnesium_polylepis.2